MKSSIKSVWRPASGAIMVGAMAFAVAAYAAPRTTEQAPSRGKDTGAVRSETAQLVTGSPEHLQVVAGVPPTAVIRLVPGVTRGPAYPAGSSIIAGPTGPVHELSTPVGGFRAWFEFQVGSWDPANNGQPGGIPNPGTVQAKLDATGYMNADTSDPGNAVGDDGDEPDLVAPVIACAGNAICVTNFIETWAKCEIIGGVGGGDDFCKAAYADKDGDHANSYCGDFGIGACSQGDCATTLPNFSCFGIANGARPDVDGTCAPSLCDGTFKYFASLVLDIPLGAKGRYTVNLLSAETFLSSSDAVSTDIPTLAEQGFTVNVPTGSCCSDLTNAAGATCDTTPITGDDGVLQSECVDAAGACVGGRTEPCIWSPGKTCAEGCVECVNNAGCDDDDSCSTETCNVALGVCVRGCVADWNTATECCDGSDSAGPVITLIDDGNICTVDACTGGAPGACSSPDPDNGADTHSAAGTGQVCDDANPCTAFDTCGGGGVSPDCAVATCCGIDVNSIPCTTDADCPLDPDGVNRACLAATGRCFCTATPDLDFIITNSPVGKAPRCVGGSEPNTPCEVDGDCLGGGTCNLFAGGGNCFPSGDDGAKVIAVAHVGAAAAPINGGQFLITYDPSCLDYNSVACQGIYTTTVYGPIVNESAGTIFIACGVNAFAGADGPAGNVDMLLLSFKKVGECNECELCFADNNPQNTYLVDDDGQRISVEPSCKSVKALGDLVLDIPDNIKTNADCDGPTADEFWDPPTATFSCGDANLTCRGAHESGLTYSQAVVLNGGTFPSGASSFCCGAAAKDECGQAVGCGSGPANNCLPATGKPEGCWTVQVNDETSLDVDVQFEPPITHNDAGGELTRCIKFCLYSDCDLQEAICYEESVTFGGQFEFVGKSRGKIKIAGTTQWGCITAQDQLHTLRSCYYFNHATDCIDGQLHAEFTGDPDLNGNWLIGGNLDGWKKDVEGSQPSLDVIDILDYGTFVSQFGGLPYPDNDTPCGTVGPNADINGDGVVTMADYNFVLKNFLVSAKECCCGAQTGTAANPITEISVDELRQLGLADLISADLNGDGLLNADDMDAFMQGARPNKPGDGRGGKGLRSGR